MSRKRKITGDVQWYLPGQKKAFAHSTVSESDAITALLDEFGDLKAVINADLILSDNEQFIMQTFVDNGVLKPKLK